MKQMRKISENNSIIQDYMKKYPGMFKITLAKMIYAEHPDKFKSVEQIRTIIRYYAGCLGTDNRKDLGNFIPMNTFIPDVSETPKPNLKIPSGKALIINDVHGHKMTENIWDYFKRGKDAGCNLVILNGDIIDHEALAKWQQLSKRQSIEEEYNLIEEFLYDIKDMFPDVRIIYKFGNHEFWLQRSIWGNPALMNLKRAEDSLQLENLLQLNVIGIEHVDYTQGIDLGLLTLWHGHEAHKGGGIYPAKNLFEYYKKDIAFGHFHRVDKFRFHVFGGRTMFSYSLPCARNKDAGYTGNNNQWEKGYAICTFTPDDYSMEIWIDDNGNFKKY